MKYADYNERAARILSEYINQPIQEIKNELTAPPRLDMGDLSLACFKMAKTLKKPPPVIAAELSSLIKPSDIIEKTESAGGYLNIHFNKELYAREVLSCVTEMGALYGFDDLYKGKTYVFDYSSPNIAKPFHVGHLPATVVGHALCNIYAALSCNVIRVNHLGDWGTQFGKLLCAYTKWGDISADNSINELSRLYVLFHKEAESNPLLDDEARNWFVKLEHGDKEALRLWEDICNISLTYYKEIIYKRLGVDFDYYTGESFYIGKIDALVTALKEKGILTKSDGALIVELAPYDMPPCLILRADGASLYAARDIAAAIYRKQTFDFDACVYLTCMDQNLHFAQWIKVVELMGHEWALDIKHLPLGQISFVHGKLSTRQGNVILLEDVLNEAKNKTAQLMEEKGRALNQTDDISEMVALTALKFQCLYHGRAVNSIFTWKSALNFDGETGPYVQYTYVRALGIISGGKEPGALIDYKHLSEPYAYALCKLIDVYPAKLKEAAARFEPYILTRYLVEVCKAFNRFYHNSPVLSAENEIKAARLLLVFCVKTVLGNCMGILGFDTPEHM